MSFSISGLPVSILDCLYEQWFVEWFRGKMERQIVEDLKADPNDVIHALEILEGAYLIEKGNSIWYRITDVGIDRYEEALPPSRVSRRVAQRRIVIEKLAEVYKQNPRQMIVSDELAKITGIPEYNELWANVMYLKKKGIVDVTSFAGSRFDSKLTAAGYQSLQKNEYSTSLAMSNAYKILFELENHLRQFIQSKLTEKFGADWWEKGVSSGLRAKSDQRHKDESALGWDVSVTQSNMEYLWFENLINIITGNWKDVFESVFKDQEKIVLKLKELETLRHAIAHTRTLSDDAISRLEQYSGDIYNMTGTIRS